jgi:peptidoglycan/LPS O-acetylase OafA/YrhL
LDGIRGIAVLIVVFTHLSHDHPMVAVSKGLKFWLLLTHPGWVGVDIFFALSGFLITRVLLGTRGKPHYYRNFYVRRLLRLMPPYLLTLVLLAIFVPGIKQFVFLSLLYLANFAPAFGVKVSYGPLWSLAVEEHFYLVWPWLVRFLRRRALFIVALLLAVASPWWRIFALRHGYYHYEYTWFKVDGILWGATVGILASPPGASNKRILLWSTLVGGVGIVGFLAVLPFAISLTAGLLSGFASMVSAGVIGYAALGVARRQLSFLRLRALRFFGDISYWVYLFHWFAMTAAIRLVPDWGTTGWAGYLKVAAIELSLCVVTGVAMRRWVELPALSLKRRFR